MFAGNAAPPSLSGAYGKSVVRDENQQVEELLSQLSFAFPMRKYQTEILGLVDEKVASGKREVHVVAPPGAGKTIIGLQMAVNFKRPTLILCPNTTIQSQWSKKLDLFVPPHLKGLLIDEIIGTHEIRPLKPITVLTYQVLSTPGREQEYLEQLAQKEWVNELRTSRSYSVGEAELRILELLQNNPKAHQREMSRHASRIRRKLTEVLKLEEVLHKNALDLIQALRRQGVGLVIFDECHHLTDYWAAIMTHMLAVLDEPLVVALTGTPPEGKTSNQENRYVSLVGAIDYQVPTPALVREGGLAPFQDLVYFTEPTVKELEFLESQHEDFHLLLDELTLKKDETTTFTSRLNDNRKYDIVDAEGNVSPLLTWVLRRTIDASETEGWRKFQEKHPALALAYLRCLYKYRLPAPRRVVLSEGSTQAPVLEDWLCILDDFASHKLKISAQQDSHELFEKIKRAARKLGYGISERGIRRQASPADRVLAFSKSKAQAVAEVLAVEYKGLEHRLRAIVVTDFERMSATGIKTGGFVIDEESGGALGVFRDLLKKPISADVNPCLVTGSLLLIDSRIKDQFFEAANQYLDNEGLNLPLTVTDFEENTFCEITAHGGEWESKLYVQLATHLFERGISKCLIGTRGLFGEGWDSQALNTLIDLTTTTAPVSVKQLRGRSIRIQTNDPLGHRKVANNWDIVCVAPQLEKGLNDYNRFVRKHEGFFGISDDGQIERGVGHVHPSLSELTALEVFASHGKLNEEMTYRALCREGIYDLWKVGVPYENRLLGCVELSDLRAPHLTPPNLKGNLTQKEHTGQMKSALIGVWGEYAGVGTVLSSGLACVLATSGAPLFLVLLPMAGMLTLAARKYQWLRSKFKKEVMSGHCQDENLKNIARAVLSALKKRRLLPRGASSDDIVVSVRSNGCFRLFLNNVDSEASKTFVNAVTEVFAPVTGQPYIIPRFELLIPDEPARAKSNAEQDKKWLQSTQARVGGESTQGKSNTGDVSLPTVIRPASKAPANLNQPGTMPQSQTPPTASIPLIFSNGDKNQATKPAKVKAKIEEKFFNAYMAGKVSPTLAGYHAVPSLLARSEKGREAFQDSWNKYVSPGEIIPTETNPDIINKYFGIGPSLAKRLLWE
ncbi:MAG: DEAD/DEAH box helicase family protein [Candidatus Obscuribacterales bacterium]|nr:DEAD/DEAH box helicase family protein [Candidatus Obscuribacterales bacterium]